MRRFKRSVMRHAGKLVAAGVVVAAPAVKAAWTLDDQLGTNVVTALSNNQQNGGNTMVPIVVGILVFCGVVGIYKRFARKAGVGT